MKRIIPFIVLCILGIGCSSNICETNADCLPGQLCVESGGVLFSGKECVRTTEPIFAPDLGEDSSVDLTESDLAEPDLSLDTDPVIADRDEDGVPDSEDNCPDLFNPTQEDTDEDGVGDACDNCPEVSNPTQTDSEGTGVGDACSPVPVGEICLTESFDFTYTPPILYVLLDNSTSMGPEISGIEGAFEQSVYPRLPQFIFGLGTFQGSVCPGFTHRLDPDTHTQMTVSPVWGQMNFVAGTPLGAAISEVNGMYNTVRGIFGERRYSVVLLFDGEPSQCLLRDAFAEARQLTERGIEFYPIAHRFNRGPESYPDELATAAAGVDTLSRRSTNQNELASHLSSIIQQETTRSYSIGCSFPIDLPNPELVWVMVRGNRILEDPVNGYTYNASDSDDGKILALQGAACEALQNRMEDADTLPLRVIGSCAPQ